VAAVFYQLATYAEEKEFSVSDVRDLCGWDESYSHQHFQRAMDLLVSDQALHTDGERYWLAS